MGITDGKLLFCHDISEQRKDRLISMIYYNDIKFYDCFNNPFPADFGIPDLNIPPVLFDESTWMNKIPLYNSDPLSAAISVTSVKSVSTFTTPSEYPKFILFNSYDPSTHHTIMSDNLSYGRVKRGYFSRIHDGIICF